MIALIKGESMIFSIALYYRMLDIIESKSIK